MRFILLLALLLYNIVANSANYDYDDADGDKRHASLNARRDWRKRALSKPVHEVGWYDERHHDPVRSVMMDREKETEHPPNDRGRRYDSNKLEARPKSTEIHHNLEEHKMEETKVHHMNCARPHERYEACFAGCAAVSCDNPRDRLRPCYPFCESGCICVHPYVRDDRTHKCVLPEDCTKGLKGIPDLAEEAS